MGTTPQIAVLAVRCRCRPVSARHLGKGGPVDVIELGVGVGEGCGRKTQPDRGPNPTVRDRLRRRQAAACGRKLCRRLRLSVASSCFPLQNYLTILGCIYHLT